MIDNRARFKLRLTVAGQLRYAEVEVRASAHRHGVVIVRCPDAIAPWQDAVQAGIDDAQHALYRRGPWPLCVELLSFRGTQDTDAQAARLATCVAIVRAGKGSKSWPKVICEADALQIVWARS